MSQVLRLGSHKTPFPVLMLYLNSFSIRERCFFIDTTPYLAIRLADLLTLLKLFAGYGKRYSLMSACGHAVEARHTPACIHVMPLGIKTRCLAYPFAPTKADTGRIVNMYPEQRKATQTSKKSPHRAEGIAPQSSVLHGHNGDNGEQSKRGHHRNGSGCLRQGRAQTGRHAPECAPCRYDVRNYSGRKGCRVPSVRKEPATLPPLRQ